MAQATPLSEKTQEEKTETMAEAEDNFMVVKFFKPYTFEEQTYKELDLTGLEDMKGADAIEVNRIVRRSGSVDKSPEFSLDFALVMASRVTGKPIEFFLTLPMNEAMKIKTRVNSFLYR